MHAWNYVVRTSAAEIAQLGERQTEDLKVPGSIPGFGKLRRLAIDFDIHESELKRIYAVFLSSFGWNTAG